MILQYINWDVDPEIFKLGPFSIRYYGLMFALTFYVGYRILTKAFILEKIDIEKLDKLTMYVAIGTIAGARIGHCLFYEPSYFLKHPLEIFLPWKGIPFTDSFNFTGFQGLASHGGAIGILISIYLFCRKYKFKMLWALDRVAIIGALAGFFIRMGNLFNSEIYGVETKLPWGFVFLRNGEELPKHPTQLYEAFAYLFIFLLLHGIYKKKSGKVNEGYLFSILLILVFVARFLIEFVKNNQETFEDGMLLNMGQILSLPFIAVGVFFYFRAKKKSN